VVGSCILSVFCVQCYPCLSFLVGSVSSFCVLCLMLPVSIVMCPCAQCYPCLSFRFLYPMLPVASLGVLCPMLPMSIFLCLVPNVTRVYRSLSCTQCYPCLSLCVPVPNVTRVYLFLYCVQCYPCLTFCVLCPMLRVSIFLCLVPNVPRFCS
jgi:hypothetical protein